MSNSDTKESLIKPTISSHNRKKHKKYKKKTFMFFMFFMIKNINFIDSEFLKYFIKHILNHKIKARDKK